MAQRASSEWEYSQWISPMLLRAVFLLVCIAHVASGVWAIAVGLRTEGNEAVAVAGLFGVVVALLTTRLLFEVAMSVFRTDARVSELMRSFKANQNGADQSRRVGPTDTYEDYKENR